MDVIATSSKDVREEVDNEENRNVDNDEVEKFVPPPEYDENDSRWTLKHREPAPGLVELMEHSGVYVNADKLAECQKWSNDCKTFAGKLLTEIFTISALSTCSWSGLDEHATNILLQFVVGYVQIRQWMGTDYQCILKAIRQVMLETKRARKRKEENEESEPLNENGSRKFVLPPEYNKNNSRWTLKYREYAPGLVELIKDSCVYVEVSKLQTKCTRVSDDGVTLARMLLPEIFTTSALSTCSLTGTDDGTNIRPGLDENAITTLLKFVKMKNGWLVTDKKRILNSIRQKMEVMRRVKRINEKEDEFGNELPAQKHCKERKLQNLPPEYDENDSRWTLKYREPAPGLVELMENSGVYVDNVRLAKCKRMSNDCQKLAQKLLTEVFTTTALSTCSFSRKNRECYDKPYHPFSSLLVCASNSAKPELDAHAEIILLNFVDEYALEKGWAILDFKLIRVSMISRIREVCKEYELADV